MQYYISIAGLYFQTVTDTKLVVDTSRGEKLKINVNIIHNIWDFDQNMDS